MFYSLIVVVITQLYKFIKNQWNILKMGLFYLGKLHLSKVDFKMFHANKTKKYYWNHIFFNLSQYGSVYF